MTDELRIGIGYDLHKFVTDRRLTLGGIEIDFELGLGGHTDGDVILHAIVDAMFGAAGLPDIGEHFPNSDPELAGRSSRDLTQAAVREIRRGGWRVSNVDVTVLAEKPRLSEHKAKIRAAVAELLEIPEHRVSIKAKTNEGCDAVGRGEAIACQACVMLQRGEW